MSSVSVIFPHQLFKNNPALAKDRKVWLVDNHMKLTLFQSPMFLNTRQEIEEWFGVRERFLHQDFYINQRKKMLILLDPEGNPLGGKWSLDAENRAPFPGNAKAPPVEFPSENRYVREASRSISESYIENYGFMDPLFIYPTTFSEAEAWLDQFLEKRFHDFGKYEDAIVRGEHILHLRTRDSP